MDTRDPTDCCIVPRKMLVGFGIKPDLIDYLSGLGANIVENEAARFRYEREGSKVLPKGEE